MQTGNISFFGFLYFVGNYQVITQIVNIWY